jgi:hypothetical protein
MEEKDNRKEKALMFTRSNIPQDKFSLELNQFKQYDFKPHT